MHEGVVVVRADRDAALEHHEVLLDLHLARGRVDVDVLPRPRRRQLPDGRRAGRGPARQAAPPRRLDRAPARDRETLRRIVRRRGARRKARDAGGGAGAAPRLPPVRGSRSRPRSRQAPARRAGDRELGLLPGAPPPAEVLRAPRRAGRPVPSGREGREGGPGAARLRRAHRPAARAGPRHRGNCGPRAVRCGRWRWRSCASRWPRSRWPPTRSSTA